MSIQCFDVALSRQFVLFYQVGYGPSQNLTLTQNEPPKLIQTLAPILTLVTLILILTPTIKSKPKKQPPKKLGPPTPPSLYFCAAQHCSKLFLCKYCTSQFQIVHLHAMFLNFFTSMQLSSSVFFLKTTPRYGIRDCFRLYMLDQVTYRAQAKT